MVKRPLYAIALLPDGKKAIAFSRRESVGVASRRHRFGEIGNAIAFL